MSARASFTQAELQRAIRAAAREGAAVRIVVLENATAIEIIPPSAVLTPGGRESNIPNQPAQEVQPGEW